MAIVVDYVKVYPIFEENCFANQLIAEVRAKRDDGVEPHIVYLPYQTGDENPVYNYISINNSTGKVYLTLEGVNAINQDYNDPSKEINELDFKVVAKDTEKGDSITIDVKVAVIRVHDEPPKITDEFIYDIYQDDVKYGRIVLDVRTLYPAYFHVVDNSYFTFRVEDFGRMTITNDGVNYLKNLNPDEVKSINVKIKIIDKQNKKAIEKNYEIPFKPGSQIEYQSKKSILEEIGVYLGQDLGTKITELKTLFEINDFKNKLIFDLISTSNYSQFDSIIDKTFNGFEVFDTLFNNKNNYSGLAKFLENLKNFDYLFKSRHENQKSKAEEAIFDNIYNSVKYITDKNQLQSFNILNNNNIPADIENLSYNLMKIKSIQEENINTKIQEALDLVSSAMNENNKNILDIINAFQEQFVKFKFVTFGKAMYDTNKKLISFQSKTNHLEDETKVLEDNVDDIYSMLYKDNWIDIIKDHNVTTYKNHVKDDVTYEYNLSTGIVGKLEEINQRDLRNWGIPKSWNFSTSSINYNSDSLITYSNGILTLSATSIRLYADGYTYIFNGSGDLTVNNLNANNCNCTAARAKYADIAENYIADQNYEYGLILTFGGKYEVTLAKKDSKKIIGVVSKEPGFLINNIENPNNIEGYILPIALKGRVYVKLDNVYKIKKGQEIYLSEIKDGYGSINGKIIIGYALHDCETDEVEIFVI